MQAAIGSLALDTARATGAGTREIELGEQVSVVDGYPHRFYVVPQHQRGMDSYPHRFHVVPQGQCGMDGYHHRFHVVPQDWCGMIREYMITHTESGWGIFQHVIVKMTTQSLIYIVNDDN